jgi:hypothetical protein
MPMIETRNVRPSVRSRLIATPLQLGLIFCLIVVTIAVGPSVGQVQPGERAETGAASKDEGADEAEKSLPPTEEEAEESYPEARVLLRDGFTVEGGLVYQDDKKVVLVVAGIEMTLDRALVRRVELLPPIEERFARMRARIPNDDHDRILNLVEWLVRDGRAMELALAEVEAVLASDPDNSRARQLFYAIGGQIALQDPVNQTDESATDRLTRAELYRLLPDNRISESDVNLLRVYEIDLDDAPRIRVPREVRERLVEDYTGHELIPNTRVARAVFMRRADKDVLRTIFRIGAREYYRDVLVLGQPESLQRFREDIHRNWLMNTCASMQCHGGLGAGRFLLHTRARSGDRTVYSNFLTIERFVTSDGKKLLDFAKPQRSLLLQYGLPRDLAVFDHPEVDNWRPVFRSMEDRRFKKALAWIDSLYQPRPDHGIEYEPPSAPTLEELRERTGGNVDGTGTTGESNR